MRIRENDPPREFEVGNGPKSIMKDCAHIQLLPGEQVTFKSEAGAEYDVARKSWGFYATPSINSRLPRFGLRAVLVSNTVGDFFVMLVEEGKDAEFEDYLADEELTVCGPLDQSTLPAIAKQLLAIREPR